MNEQQELTITQIMEIMGWAYPKTLRFAKKYGRQLPESERSKWLVPLSVVESQVDKQTLKASRSQALLWQYGHWQGGQ